MQIMNVQPLKIQRKSKTVMRPAIIGNELVNSYQNSSLIKSSYQFVHDDSKNRYTGQQNDNQQKWFMNKRNKSNGKNKFQDNQIQNKFSNVYQQDSQSFSENKNSFVCQQSQKTENPSFIDLRQSNVNKQNQVIYGGDFHAPVQGQGQGKERQEIQNQAIQLTHQNQIKSYGYQSNTIQDQDFIPAVTSISKIKQTYGAQTFVQYKLNNDYGQQNKTQSNLSRERSQMRPLQSQRRVIRNMKQIQNDQTESSILPILIKNENDRKRSLSIQRGAILSNRQRLSPFAQYAQNKYSIPKQISNLVFNQKDYNDGNRSAAILVIGGDGIIQFKNEDDLSAGVQQQELFNFTNFSKPGTEPVPNLQSQLAQNKKFDALKNFRSSNFKEIKALQNQNMSFRPFGAKDFQKIFHSQNNQINLYSDSKNQSLKHNQIQTNSFSKQDQILTKPSLSPSVQTKNKKQKNESYIEQNKPNEIIFDKSKRVKSPLKNQDLIIQKKSVKQKNDFIKIQKHPNQIQNDLNFSRDKKQKMVPDLSSSILAISKQHQQNSGQTNSKGINELNNNLERITERNEHVKSQNTNRQKDIGGQQLRETSKTSSQNSQQSQFQRTSKMVGNNQKNNKIKNTKKAKELAKIYAQSGITYVKDYRAHNTSYIQKEEQNIKINKDQKLPKPSGEKPNLDLIETSLIRIGDKFDRLNCNLQKYQEIILPAKEQLAQGRRDSYWIPEHLFTASGFDQKEVERLLLQSRGTNSRAANSRQGARKKLSKHVQQSGREMTQMEPESVSSRHYFNQLDQEQLGLFTNGSLTKMQNTDDTIPDISQTDHFNSEYHLLLSQSGIMNNPNYKQNDQKSNDILQNIMSRQSSRLTSRIQGGRINSLRMNDQQRRIVQGQGFQNTDDQIKDFQHPGVEASQIDDISQIESALYEFQDITSPNGNLSKDKMIPISHLRFHLNLESSLLKEPGKLSIFDKKIQAEQNAQPRNLKSQGGNRKKKEVEKVEGQKTQR